MKSKKLYIAMVGLPARGKSTIATKLKEYPVREAVKTRIFNNGDLRRKMIRGNTSYAGFFDSNSREGVAIREKSHFQIWKRLKSFSMEQETLQSRMHPISAVTEGKGCSSG